MELSGKCRKRRWWVLERIEIVMSLKKQCGIQPLRIMGEQPLREGRGEACGDNQWIIILFLCERCMWHVHCGFRNQPVTLLCWVVEECPTRMSYYHSLLLLCFICGCKWESNSNESVPGQLIHHRSPFIFLIRAK